MTRRRRAHAAPVHDQGRIRRHLTRPPTVRELDALHQQLNQLAIAAPSFVRPVALIVNDVFGALLATGTVVPTTKGGLERLWQASRAVARQRHTTRNT